MTSAQLFQPSNGVQAVWVPIYQYLRTLGYGNVVAYSKFDELLGRDTRSDRQPIYRAMRELEKHDHRTLVSIPRVGYGIARPDQHRSQAEKHRKRSYRQVGKARAKIRSAPRELLPEQELRWLDETEIRLAQLESGLRRTNRRVSMLEKKVEVKEDALAKIQADLEKLRKKGLFD